MRVAFEAMFFDYSVDMTWQGHLHLYQRTVRVGVWHGVAWRGMAWRGVAWRGVAWCGVVRSCVVWW